MEIKWNLKAERIVDAKNKADDVEKAVIKWCGENHPALAEFYSVFANYYMNKNKYEEAVNCGQTALAIYTSNLGNNSLKTA